MLLKSNWLCTLVDLRVQFFFFSISIGQSPLHSFPANMGNRCLFWHSQKTISTITWILLIHVWFSSHNLRKVKAISPVIYSCLRFLFLQIVSVMFPVACVVSIIVKKKSCWSSALNRICYYSLSSVLYESRLSPIIFVFWWWKCFLHVILHRLFTIFLFFKQITKQ